MKRDLGERLFSFATSILLFLREIEDQSSEFDIIRYQLAKSATSSGANYEESQASTTRAGFKYRVDISLREMRESNYWLRILSALEIGNRMKKQALIKESVELRKILGTISEKASRKT